MIVRCSSVCLTAAMLTLFALQACDAEAAEPGTGDPFPLAECILLEVPLDETARCFLVDGREFRVCCEDCQQQLFSDQFSLTRRIDEILVVRQRPFYPLSKCIVDQKPLAEGAIDHILGNRLFRLCSRECRGNLEREPEKFFGRLDFAVIEKQAPTYRLTKSIVSGKPLGEKAVNYVIANQLVRLAGPDEIAQFNSKPGQYLAELRAAAKDKSRR